MSGADRSGVCLGIFDEVDYQGGTETVRHVLEGLVNFLDTSNGYSDGESERRMAQSLRNEAACQGDSS